MKDDILLRVIQRCIGKWLPSDAKDPVYSSYYKVLVKFSVKWGVIFRNDQVVVSVNLRQRILQVGHKGHPNIVKMRQRLRNSVWWPGWIATSKSISSSASHAFAVKSGTVCYKAVTINFAFIKAIPHYGPKHTK